MILTSLLDPEVVTKLSPEEHETLIAMLYNEMTSNVTIKKQLQEAAQKALPKILGRAGEGRQ